MISTTADELQFVNWERIRLTQDQLNDAVCTRWRLPVNWDAFKLSNRNRMLTFYFEPNKRPPVLDEMMPDIERLIHSVAYRHSDNTSPDLCYQELVGEGNLKLTELINHGELDRQLTRSNFFKFLKTSLENQARSRVQKYRFTEKRTGVKPPPREERFISKPNGSDDIDEPLHQKQVEISLDDPNQHLQVPDAGHDAHAWTEVLEEYCSLLTEPEQVVLRQMACPNEWAWAVAYVDSFIGKMHGKTIIKIKQQHLALGLRMSDELFEEIVLSIRQKVQAYRAMTDTDDLKAAQRNAVLAQLKAVFGVQIPPIADTMLIRRLFTIAARDQHTKLNAQVVEMLEFIGAKVPRVHKDMLSCYGVLYLAHDRRCESCGLKRSCFVEASNLGLTKITLSPRLLGSRQTRSPVILPTMVGEKTVTGSFDEEDILNYLAEYFVQFKRREEIYYGHEADTAGRQVLLFCLGTQVTPLSLRFCSPSDELKKKLVPTAKCWYPPQEATTQEVTALIDQHAKEALRG
jgi:hypothetical protein